MPDPISIKVSDGAASVGAASEKRTHVVNYRGGRFQPMLKRSISGISVAILIVVWDAAVRLGLVNPFFLPSPLEVAQSLWSLLVHGYLLQDIAISLTRILSGWLIGTMAGLCVGVLMGISTVGRSAGLPIISALFPIPKIALLPLFILWFGIGEPSKVATIALGVFFPTAISTFSGVDNVARSLVRMGLSFNMPTRGIILKILLPGSLPNILAGMRISSSIALILLVAAEMIGAERGLGAFVLQAGNLMQTDQLLAGVAVLSMLGLIVSSILTSLEKKFLGWR